MLFHLHQADLKACKIKENNAVTIGKCSLHQIAVQSSLIFDGATPLSPQAIHQRPHRTIPGTERFLMHCFRHIISQKCSACIRLRSPSSSILIEDSSQLALHAHNAEELPVHGNHLGCTAGCKIDLCADLLTGHHLINDLILRDMGYTSPQMHPPTGFHKT